MSQMIAYASSILGAGNIGTGRFGDNDLNAPMWWDTNGDVPDATRTTWTNEIINELASLPHVNLNMVYTESKTQPSVAHVKIESDNGNPPPGSNATFYNTATHEITQGIANFPDLSMTKYTFRIEIYQAIGDLNDVGAGDPFILTPGTYVLNNTGRQIFSIMYLADPKTKFNY